MSLRSIREERFGVRAGGAAGLLMALALLILGAIFVAVQQRVDTLRDEVEEIAEPAADLIANVQYLLARQTSSLRGYLITRDSAYLEQYASLRSLEAEVYPELERHAAALSTAVAADVAELALLSARWHSRLEVEAIIAEGTTAGAPVVLLEQELYRGALEAASRATLTIRQVVRDRQQQIERVERNARLIFTFLFGLAGVIAISVAVLNARIRTLAKIADARRLETEAAMKQTENAVAAREYLIRGFTHDVKNPLGVADGYAELLELGLRGELAPPQREMIDRIRAGIRGAIEIINELLEISRLEGGGLQVKREVIDLRTLAHDVIEGYAMAAAAAGLAIRVSDSGDFRKSIATFTDPDRVRQVLQNLISNALKYTPPPGEIIVSVDVSSGEADRVGPWVRLMVTDTGPGIPVEEQERIFYEFHRVPGETAAGHGLGLAISRRIAQLLGGDVTVQSVPDQGATFVLWLPLRPEESDRLVQPDTVT